MVSLQHAVRENIVSKSAVAAHTQYLPHVAMYLSQGRRPFAKESAISQRARAVSHGNLECPCARGMAYPPRAPCVFTK